MIGSNGISYLYLTITTAVSVFVMDILTMETCSKSRTFWAIVFGYRATLADRYMEFSIVLISVVTICPKPTIFALGARDRQANGQTDCSTT